MNKLDIEKALQSNMLLESNIPLQLPIGSGLALRLVSDTASTFTTATFVGSFILNVILSLSIQSLVSAVNTMQLLTHVNLFNVKQPANTNRFFLYFVKLCTFELIPTDGLMTEYFALPDNGSLNINFEYTGYESIYAISNLGLVYLIFHIFLVVSLLNFCLYIFTIKCRQVNRVHQKINKKLYWNGYLILIFETFFDTFMCILVNMKVADWADQ